MKRMMILSALLLAGCSSEPSESNMLEALNRNPQWMMTLGMLSGREPAEAMKAGVLEKASCAEAQGSPGHVCDFRWGMKQPNGNVQYGTPAKGRFYKAGEGWQVEFAGRR